MSSIQEETTWASAYNSDAFVDRQQKALVDHLLDVTEARLREMGDVKEKELWAVQSLRKKAAAFDSLYEEYLARTKCQENQHGT